MDLIYKNQYFVTKPDADFFNTIGLPRPFADAVRKWVVPCRTLSMPRTTGIGALQPMGDGAAKVL
jgi:hypothetical protein